GSSLGNGAAIAPSPNHKIIMPDLSSFPCWHVSSDVSESCAWIVCRAVVSRQHIGCRRLYAGIRRVSLDVALRIRFLLYRFQGSDQELNQTMLVVYLRDGVTGWRLRNPATRATFLMLGESIAPAIIGARIFLRVGLSVAALCPARSPKILRSRHCSTTATSLFSAPYKIPSIVPTMSMAS